MVNGRLATVFLVTSIVAVSTVAAQQDEDPQVNRVLGDKFSFRLIGGLVIFNSDVAAGRNLGAVIDLEDTLGFDEQMGTFGLDGFWRFSKNLKHTLRLRYGDFDRDAEKTVEGTVPIFDVDFAGRVSSGFVNQVGTVEYQYSFINHQRTEAGFTAGLGIYRYRLEVEGQVVIDNDPNATNFRDESVGVVAPVPAVGFFINQALRENLILELRTSFIDLEIGEHSGRVFSSWVNLTWYFTRNWGVGLGFSGSDVNYKMNSSDEKLSVDLRQNGLSFNVTAVF